MEDEKTTENENVLEGWTKEEKFELLLALKEYGSYNIDAIYESVTNKTKDEIKTAIEYYREKALVHPNLKHKKVKRFNKIPAIPLASWAKFLLDSHGFEDLQTDIATAIRLIANFEEKPPGVCTEKFDFKKIYHVLADALEGKPIPNNKFTLALFDKCLVETALTSKAFIRSTTYKQIMKSINMTEKEIEFFTKPSSDNELINLRHLILQKNYNPLNIPEKYLRSSAHSS